MFQENITGFFFSIFDFFNFICRQLETDSLESCRTESGITTSWENPHRQFLSNLFAVGACVTVLSRGVLIKSLGVQLVHVWPFSREGS